MRHLTPICAALLGAAILSGCSDDNALATEPGHSTAEAAIAGGTAGLKTLKEKGDVADRECDRRHPAGSE